MIFNFNFILLNLQADLAGSSTIIMRHFTLLFFLTLAGFLATPDAIHAQSPRIQVVQEGGCSDADPFFRIRGRAFDLPDDPNLRPRWTLPGPPPELRDNREFLDLSDAVGTDRTYAFELIDARNGRSVFQAETTLTLRRPQPVRFEWSPNPVCDPEQEVTFRVLANPNWDYIWNIEGERTGSELTHRFSRTGSFQVEVFTRRDDNGCPTPVARQTVVVHSSIQPRIEALSLLGCSSVMDGRAEYVFIARSPMPASERTNWGWTFDRSHPILTETVDTLRVRLPSGLFEVKYEIVNQGGCAGEGVHTFRLTTREHPLPELERIPDRPVYCAGETVILRNATNYLEDRHRGNTAIFRLGRPWVNPFDKDHEYTSDRQEEISLEVRIYDHVRIGTQQCIWIGEPVQFRFVGPPPNFEASNSSRGICSVPATSEIRIGNLKRGVRYTWTIFDEDGNVVEGFPRTVTDEEFLEFQVTEMPRIYAVQLEEETPFGCWMRRRKPAFIISAGNLEADFIIKDPNANPDFLFCRRIPQEPVRLVSTSRPLPYGLELTWYYSSNEPPAANPDGYIKFGEGDSVDWLSITPGIKSIKLRISNFGQCWDSTYRERAVTFIEPDWGIRIEPPAGCAPKTHRITAYNKNSFPADFPVFTSFIKRLGSQGFRQIDERTIEIDFTENLQNIWIEFGYGFENTSCLDTFVFRLTSGVSTRLSTPEVGCVGDEGWVRSETDLANPPTRFVWLIEGSARVERIEETENLFRFRPLDSRRFRIGQQIFLENETDTCRSEVAWSEWLQADDFPIELSVVGEAEKECIPALFNFNVSGQNIREVRWDWGDGSPAQITQISQAAHTYTDSLGGRYRISVEARSGKGCISRDTLSVQVSVPLPAFRFTPDTRILCNGEELRITNETDDPIRELVIDWGDDAPLLVRTEIPQGETLTHLYRWEGTDLRPVFLRYVVDLGKCRPVVGIRRLEIQPPLRISLDSIPILCLQSERVATVRSPSNDLARFRWELLPETAAEEALSWAFQETTEPQNQLTALKPGRWPVRVVGLRVVGPPEEIRLCEAADTFLVEVVRNQVELLPLNNRNPCLGETVRIEAGDSAGLLYRWTIGDATPVETGSQPWIDWQFERGGSHAVRLEVVDMYGCTLRAEVTDFADVVEPVWPEAPTAERDKLCQTETLRVRTTGLPEGTPVQWRIRRLSNATLLDEGWSASALPFTLEWPLTEGLTGDALLVELRAELPPACMTNSALVRVDIPDPVNFNFSLNYSHGPCPPTELQVRLMDGNATQIQWDADADGQFDGQGHSYTWSIEPTGGLDRSLRIQAQNEAGCLSDTMLALVFQAQPELHLKYQSPVCVGSTDTLEALARDGRPWREVSWRIEGQSPESGTQIRQFWSERGQYSVWIVARDTNGCPAEGRTEIRVQGPEAGFEVNQPTEPDTLYFPPPVRMEIRSRATGASHIDWQWNHLEALSTDPSIELPRKSGRYSLLQVVRDDLGCRDSIRRYFIVEPVLLQLSSVFTPNGDGVNDVWQVIYSGEGAVRVWVYDRAGVLVFQGQGQNLVWDGRNGGREVPAGVYFWRVRTPAYDRTGSLTLVR